MKRALIAVGLAALLAGCGGGGGTGSGSPSLVSLFITDSMDGNDHVWVTVKSVDLLSAGGSTNVFTDSTGVQVDLKTLRDVNGARFQFLNQDSVPAGTYTGAKVTLDKNLVVFPHLATTGTAMTFDNQYDDGNGNSVISFQFEHPHTVNAGSDDVIVDFDLANWNESGGVVTVSLKEGDGSGIDDSDRHEKIHYPGTVSNLTGTSPDFTFTLTHHDSNGFPISTNANTTFFESDGQPPVLDNGKDVIVQGSWDPVSGTLVADSVQVLLPADEQGEDASAEGPVTEFSADQGFVRITTHEAEGFTPMADSVRIEFSDTTVFVENDTAVTEQQFFTDLTNGDEVEADGSYDPGTFVLTATHVHVHHEDGSGGGDTGGSTGDSTGGTTGDSTGTTGTTGDTTGGTTGETTGSTA